MKKIIIFLLLVSRPGLAILPPPYPLEWITVFIDRSDSTKMQALLALQESCEAEEWELPAFENRPGTLGYVNGVTFSVPASMRPRVDFWKKIFTIYSKHQIVLHDEKYPEIIYGTVDLYPLDLRNQTFVEQAVSIEKRKIEAKLRILHQLERSPLRIPVELFGLFKKFEHVRSPMRFLKAAERIRAQVGQKEFLVQGFARGGKYFPKMMEIFAQYGLPTELTRLPLVESSFNLKAVSKVGAAGVWQFMRATGKQFLRIDQAVDERRDPLLATRAAAELLKQNYDVLGDWALAVTAYNHGRAGIAQAIRTLATNELAAIIERYEGDQFGFASANFFAEFLAVLEIERDYRRLLGPLKGEPPVSFELLPLADNVRLDELALACDMGEDVLAELNPSLTEWVLTGKGFVPSGFNFRIPIGLKDRCASGYQNIGKISLERY